MTRDEMLRELERILEKPPGTFKGAERLADISNWDSLAILTFITAADRLCSVRLKAEQILACATVNDLLALVRL
ncbi:MAG: phosphopantetheine-binding protein [bacterium]